MPSEDAGVPTAAQLRRQLCAAQCRSLVFFMRRVAEQIHEMVDEAQGWGDDPDQARQRFAQVLQATRLIETLDFEQPDLIVLLSAFGIFMSWLCDATHFIR